MTVLIVTESYFGNTLTVTQAIASGLVQALGQGHVTVLRPSEAPVDLPPDVNLLRVGAPTHDFSMPKEQTRKQAAEKGATGGDSVGVREWIAQVTPRSDLRVLTFDTSLKAKSRRGRHPKPRSRR